MAPTGFSRISGEIYAAATAISPSQAQATVSRGFGPDVDKEAREGPKS
jgi:hypothetical protein